MKTIMFQPESSWFKYKPFPIHVHDDIKLVGALAWFDNADRMESMKHIKDANEQIWQGMTRQRGIPDSKFYQ